MLIINNIHRKETFLLLFRQPGEKLKVQLKTFQIFCISKTRKETFLLPFDTPEKNLDCTTYYFFYFLYICFSMKIYKIHIVHFVFIFLINLFLLVFLWYIIVLNIVGSVLLNSSKALRGARETNLLPF